MSIRSGLLATTVFVATTSLAQAEVWTIQPRLSGGVQDYELSFADVTFPNANGGITFRDGFTVSDNISFVGGGVTVSRGRFFADLAGQWSGTGEDQTFIFQGTQGTISNNVGHSHSLDATFDREEFNLSLGWAVSQQLSVYAGFKRAALDMTQARLPVTSPPAVYGDVLQVGNYLMDFSYQGAFAGATFSVPVKSWGAFAIQTSVARLNAKFKQRFDGLVVIYLPPLGAQAVDPSYITDETSGRSTGFNVGVSWTGNFGSSGILERFSYTLGLDRSTYEFAAANSTTGDFDETNTRARLDLRYRFAFGEE
jgi:hypothetical protein